MNSPLEASSAADAERYRLCWAIHPADLTTPVRAFRALRAAGHHACLLESVEGPARLARFSFVGVDPSCKLRGGPGGATLTTEDGTEELAGPSHHALREASRRFAAPSPPPGLPPFCGGWIGFFSYEWSSSLEPRVPITGDDPFGVPEAVFDFYRDVLAFDHATQRMIVITSCPGGETDHEAAAERIERLCEALETDTEGEGGFRLLEDSPRPQMSREEFEAGVEKLRGDIAQGEIFQAVLSQRFEQRFEGDPFTLYRVLRLVNPAPHMFFFEADGLTLIGSSPERLVSVKAGVAENRPIAGTRPRSEDPDEDRRLAAELAASPKERAEHDMLVDLARNDLGRVARIGTVRLREHAVLERFARVQHLVSRVECQLAAGRDALDALVASFPAGTVSGAPKVRAMELIAGLEPQTRGPYAGAFGYLDGSGNLDVALVIRSFVAQGGRLSVQAGAGIVFDSDPEGEYDETRHKARALFDAAELASSPSFR